MHPLTGLVALGLLAIIVYRRVIARKLPLPPGPTGELIAGSLKPLMTLRPWLVYMKWAETYGPVISYRVYHQRVVVLNSAKAVVDLLESKAPIYSDRPIMWMGQHLIGRADAVFNISALNPRHKKYRKQLHSGLNSRATQTYLPIITQETSTFLKALATTPDDFIVHLGRNAGATILKLTYGWKVTSNDDEFLKIISEGMEVSQAAREPGKWLVDTIPWLRFVPAWFPGAEFKRTAARYKECMSRIDVIPFNWTKEQIKSGDYIESFTSMGLQGDNGKPLTPEQNDILKWCAAALYAGGAPTTVVALTSFFLRMGIHQDVQQRAQAEIDQLLNNARLPTIDDQKDLPYTTALVKEVFRHAPVAPLGVPHRVTQDDFYEGYCIPKGTTVHANIWAITRDSEMYPNPSVFNPERFFARPGFEPQTDPRKWVFGFGRRVCPGAHFAETSFFLNIASILATFNIGKAFDASGCEIGPEIDYMIATASNPKPFQCKITPRSPDLLASLGIAVA